MVGTISDGWHSFPIRWHLPRAGARCGAAGACSLRLGERPLEIAERMDTGCARRLAEVLSYPDVPEQWRSRELERPMSPMLTFVFRKADTELRFFSTWTTFGAPHDVTLEEVRIESSFPADELTSRIWRDLTAR